MARNYRAEYDRYQGKPSQIKRRSMRNKARRKLAKKVGKAKLRGKDVHHKRGMHNSMGNLAAISPSKNRSFKRSKTGKNLGLRKRK
jgi:hypothetical protein